MSRTVRQLNTTADKAEEGRPRPFSDFDDYPDVVVLGDPGAGKSHLFRERATAEGARLIRAGAFSVVPPHTLSGQSLYIDGLDERRAGRGDRSAVEAMVEKLFAVNPPRVRISCRAADWLGESDLDAFRPFFEQRGVPPVLLLQRLSEEEQIAVLAGEGVDRVAATSFLAEAIQRGLNDFLENPQNLLMLWRAVKTGSWPKNRRELFELATELMLQEFDPDRARTGGGSYSVAELRPSAGAICAARLISDVEAIGLSNQQGTREIPGYRSQTLTNPEQTLAALGRRIFVAGTESETVDYAHRTTAEYLGAAFLAAQVRAGLPLGRVRALLGVDGHPASELRGLHAWLAVHLPEHADELIETDPYGVLTYGDAASLPPSSCAHLVRSLDRLSRQNPWFRSANWKASPIGALARPDMVDEFRKILNDPNGGWGVRSVIVEALSLGVPIPEMLMDLEAILLRSASAFGERAHALSALTRLGASGKASILAAHEKLGKSTNDLRLRTDIIRTYYGAPFGSDDVVDLVTDNLDAGDAAIGGMLWSLADRIPDVDLPVLLDEIPVPPDGHAGFDTASWEVSGFYSRILVRAWRSQLVIEPSRALNWLYKRVAFKGSDSRARSLREAFATNGRLEPIAEYFFSTLTAERDSWYKFNKFREAIHFQLSSRQLRSIAMRHLDTEADGTEKQSLLYELALVLCFADDRADAAFEQLYVLGETNVYLQNKRDRALRTDLPANYFSGRQSGTENANSDREQMHRDFVEQVNLIRAGRHLGWIAHLAKIYFGLYGDSDHSLTPHQRLADALTEENVSAALEGLRAVLTRDDLPGLAEVMRLAETHHHHGWWYGIVAGLNERWSAGQGFAGLSDDQIRALVAFGLLNNIHVADGEPVEHLWMNALLTENPELVHETYRAIARSRLERGEQFVAGLTELLADGPLAPYRKDVLLEFLHDFPNTDPLRLDELLASAMATPAASGRFVQLAAEVLSEAQLDQRQRDMWLIAAYLFSPQIYQDAVTERAREYPHLIFELRDRGGFGWNGKGSDNLSLGVLEFMAQLTGSSFANVPAPMGGWSGDTNAWDGSEYFRTLINRISSVPSNAATEALERLSADSSLVSYRDDILYALANQWQRRRDAEYDRPDWPKTIAALSNGPPATVADLHALLSDHLRDLKQRIERANTDIWKRFWNVDAWARPVEPRPEEACRDDLVGMMRPPLYPLGITVEPEGHMAADKRADISVAMPGRKILCELKRDYHSEVWTAALSQLERFYLHDPDTDGFGVYCVFWFGSGRKRSIPYPPNGLPQPTSAAQMQEMLRDLIPEKLRSRILVMVIDVSGQY